MIKTVVFKSEIGVDTTLLCDTAVFLGNCLILWIGIVNFETTVQK